MDAGRARRSTTRSRTAPTPSSPTRSSPARPTPSRTTCARPSATSATPCARYAATGWPVTVATLTDAMVPDRLEWIGRALPDEHGQAGPRLSSTRSPPSNAAASPAPATASRSSPNQTSPSASTREQPTRHSIDLLRAVQHGDVVLFRLDADRRPLLAAMLAAAIVQDLLTVAADLQHAPVPTLVLVDEFSAVAPRRRRPAVRPRPLRRPEPAARHPGARRPAPARQPDARRPGPGQRHHADRPPPGRPALRRDARRRHRHPRRRGRTPNAPRTGSPRHPHRRRAPAPAPASSSSTPTPSSACRTGTAAVTSPGHTRAAHHPHATTPRTPDDRSATTTTTTCRGSTRRCSPPPRPPQLLAVKPSWIYEAVRAGTLPCLRIGRHIRFTRDDARGLAAGAGGVTKKRVEAVGRSVRTELDGWGTCGAARPHPLRSTAIVVDARFRARQRHDHRPARLPAGATPGVEHVRRDAERSFDLVHANDLGASTNSRRGSPATYGERRNRRPADCRPAFGGLSSSRMTGSVASVPGCPQMGWSPVRIDVERNLLLVDPSPYAVKPANRRPYVPRGPRMSDIRNHANLTRVDDPGRFADLRELLAEDVRVSAHGRCALARNQRRGAGFG